MDKTNLYKIDELLKSYEPITLSAMDGVKLMDRVDSKFVLTFNDIIPVLEKIAGNYFILKINNKRIFSYRTDYYDTPGLEMFTDHHNGKLNRFKIRQREYIESEIRFLEVKFKSNKGRVVKDRIEIKTGREYNFTGFIKKYTPYDPDKLQITLCNQFNRFTLVDKGMQERVTVDLNLMFSDNAKNIGLNGLVVVELKQNKNSRESSIYSALKEKGIRPASFSKYCMGVTLLRRHDKFNNFKRTIYQINKLSRVESIQLPNIHSKVS